MTAGFHDLFVPFVADGSKTHTFRSGERWKVGMRLDAFARSRRPDMRLILRAPVIKVEPARIHESRTHPLLVCVNDINLSVDETEALFHRDGFRNPGWSSARQALEYLIACKRPLPFVGQLVYWDYSQASFK